MKKEKAVQFIQSLFAEVWGMRDEASVPKYYHKDFVGILNEEEEFFYSDVLKRVAYSKNRYDNPQYTFHDISPVESNRIVARYSGDAFDKISNEQARFHFCMIVELREDKAYRLWVVCNVSYRYKDWKK